MLWIIYSRLFQSNLLERNAEVKDILENFTNIEKQCEGIGLPVSAELQVKLSLIFLANIINFCSNLQNYSLNFKLNI